MSSIHEAAEDGREEELQKLLQRNIQAVNEEDEFGETPLHLACMAGHPNCVKLLLHNGAQVDRQNANGTTPLHYSARYGRQACVTLLLRNGASVTRKDNAHWTPLHYATINAQTKCAILLIEKGADVNALTSDHNTPLHLAAAAGVTDCVLLLIKHGAKLNVKNKEGNTPLSVLTIKDKTDVDKTGKNTLRRLSEDLRVLVNDKTYADVAFIVEGNDRRTLYAHKNIVSARCPRLQELVQQHERNSKEDASTASATSTTTSSSSSSSGGDAQQFGGHLTLVHVQGMSAPVFEGLLHFLYSGDVPAMTKLVVSLATAPSETEKVKELVPLVELMRAAEIYNYPHLTSYCEEILAGNLNVETAIEFLSMTDSRKKGVTGLREWVTLPGMNNDEIGRRCLARVRKIIGEYLIAHFNEATEGKSFRKLKKELLVDLLAELAFEQKHKPAEYVRRAAGAKKVEKPDAMKDRLLTECNNIMHFLRSQENAWPFNQPVDPVSLGIPTYFDIIKEPMDFGTITEKLAKGKYNTLSEFERDVQLVFSNALLFNEPDSDIGFWAKGLRGLFERRAAKLQTIVKEIAQQQQRQSVSHKELSSSATTAPSSTSSASSASTPTPAATPKKRPGKPAPAKPTPAISPEELEVARARLSQNVNRLSPHQLMEVLTMIQQASSMPTGEEGDSNGDIEIDLNELPPDALVRIQSYVDGCLAAATATAANNGSHAPLGDDEEHEEMTIEEEDDDLLPVPTTSTTSTSTTSATGSTTGSAASRKRGRPDLDFEVTPEEWGGGLDPKNENGGARREKRRKERSSTTTSGGGSDGGGDHKRKRRHHHPRDQHQSSASSSAGTLLLPSVSSSSASGHHRDHQRKAERSKQRHAASSSSSSGFKEEQRDENYTPASERGSHRASSSSSSSSSSSLGSTSAAGGSVHAPTSFEHIEFGPSSRN